MPTHLVSHPALLFQDPISPFLIISILAKVDGIISVQYNYTCKFASNPCQIEPG